MMQGNSLFYSVRKLVPFSFSKLNCAFFYCALTLNSLLMVSYAFEDFQPVAAIQSRLDIRHQDVAEFPPLGQSVTDQGSENPLCTGT